ncbi:MAG: hypothetical protein RLZZ608_678 [Actinomycetota bacterium]
MAPVNGVAVAHGVLDGADAEDDDCAPGNAADAVAVALAAGASKPGVPAMAIEPEVGGTNRTGSLTGKEGAARRREPGVLAEPIAGEYGVDASGAAEGRSGTGAEARGTAIGGGGVLAGAVGMAGIALVDAAGTGSAKGGGT